MVDKERSDEDISVVSMDDDKTIDKANSRRQEMPSLRKERGFVRFMVVMIMLISAAVLSWLIYFVASAEEDNESNVSIRNKVVERCIMMNDLSFKPLGNFLLRFFFLECYVGDSKLQ